MWGCVSSKPTSINPLRSPVIRRLYCPNVAQAVSEDSRKKSLVAKGQDMAQLGPLVQFRRHLAPYLGSKNQYVPGSGIHLPDYMVSYPRTQLQCRKLLPNYPLSYRFQTSHFCFVDGTDFESMQTRNNDQPCNRL